MEDFCYAGGLPVVVADLISMGLLESGAFTVTGKTIGENVENAECYNRDVIRPVGDPFYPPDHGTAVLFGNLCPRGAVLKRSAASQELLTHRGRAVVFDSPEAYNAVCDDVPLDIEPDDVLVVRYAGPRGYPGMPEVANVPIPTKLLRAGVTDMVRICDGRMSGTGYGTVIVHVAPEAAIGGLLALVETGHVINLDVAARTLHLEVDDAEVGRRRSQWQPPPEGMASGYSWLYTQHVLQADEGADFAFLQGQRGAEVPRHSH